jgi:protein TonB
MDDTAVFPDSPLTAPATSARSCVPARAPGRRRGHKQFAVLGALAVHVVLAAVLIFRRPEPEPVVVEQPTILYLRMTPPAPQPPKTVVKPAPDRPPTPTKAVKPVEPVLRPRPAAQPTPDIPTPTPLAVAPRETTPEPPAAKPAAAPQPAASSASAEPRPSSNFQNQVLARIEQARRYPAAARARHEEGVATVRFKMSRGGKVLSASVTKSAGSALLDREAVDTVRRASLPAIPADLGDPLILVVSIEFFVKN